MGTDSNELIRTILSTTRRIAVVGVSANPARPSHGVFGFLVARGYDVVGVNPGLAGQRIQGAPVVGTLAEAGPLDMVDVFRASDQLAGVVAECIRLGAVSVWAQLGVVDAAAAAAADAAGLRMVMDRCPAIEWRRLGLPGRVADFEQSGGSLNARHPAGSGGAGP